MLSSDLGRVRSEPQSVMCLIHPRTSQLTCGLWTVLLFDLRIANCNENVIKMQWTHFQQSFFLPEEHNSSGQYCISKIKFLT